jgi:hypothetical protein
MYQQNNAISKQKPAYINLVLFVVMAVVVIVLMVKEMDRFLA